MHVDPVTGKADGPHRKKLRTYLGIVARDKVDVTYDTCKEVTTAQKDLIWEDIQVFLFSYLILFNNIILLPSKKKLMTDPLFINLILYVTV